MFVATARVVTIAALAVGAYYALSHSPADMAADVLALPIALKCCVVANVFFWANSTVCLLLDSMPRSTKLGRALAASKIQHKYFTAQEFWFDAVCVAVMNLLVLAPLACFPYERVWSTGLGGWYIRTQESDEFRPLREFGNLLGSALIVNVWFYWSHRAIHHKLLYGPIHKIHHTWTSPCSVAAVYAHPVEFIFSNVASIALGPLLTNAHPYTAYFWFGLTLFQTTCAHSGCVRAPNTLTWHV
jgi:sterol desaturase/sphingolipid hydroxylase (fatty acid hydroxylase superfamily)